MGFPYSTSARISLTAAQNNAPQGRGETGGVWLGVCFLQCNTGFIEEYYVRVSLFTERLLACKCVVDDSRTLNPSSA